MFGGVDGEGGEELGQTSFKDNMRGVVRVRSLWCEPHTRVVPSG